MSAPSPTVQKDRLPSTPAVVVLLAFSVAVTFALLGPLALGELSFNRARFSIWATIALATPAVVLFAVRDGREPLGDDWRWWWTASFALFVLHLWYGFGVIFGGKVGAVFADQGKLVAASNFLLAFLWAASVVAAWTGHGPRWLHCVATALFAVNAIVSSAVFGLPTSKIIGIVFIVAIVAAALARVWLVDKQQEALMAQAQAGQPSAPVITLKLLLQQFWADIYGKEVQSAATYSYMWMADQGGHICLGILINFGISWLAGWIFDPGQAELTGLIGGAIIVSLWEVSAYRTDVKKATGRFPLDKKTLGANAFIAAAYMVFGVVIGYGFHLGFRISGWWGVGLFVAMAVLAVVCAPWWLRQKITWQRASLPYLARLADMPHTIGASAAGALQKLIDAGAPPDVTPRQVVIAGPIGSGRTPLASGIGTEFAFKKCKARYLNFDSLLEFAVPPVPPKIPPVGDDSGPKNLAYWPWYDAQVLILDDIGPLIAAQHAKSTLDQFKTILAHELKPVQDLLAIRHTVWIIGDLANTASASAPAHVAEYAQAIRDYCRGKEDPLVIELELEQTPEGVKGVAHVRGGHG